MRRSCCICQAFCLIAKLPLWMSYGRGAAAAVCVVLGALLNNLFSTACPNRRVGCFCCLQREEEAKKKADEEQKAAAAAGDRGNKKAGAWGGLPGRR